MVEALFAAKGWQWSIGFATMLLHCFLSSKKQPRVAKNTWLAAGRIDVMSSCPASKNILSPPPPNNNLLFCAAGLSQNNDMCEHSSVKKELVFPAFLTHEQQFFFDVIFLVFLADIFQKRGVFVRYGLKEGGYWLCRKIEK